MAIAGQVSRRMLEHYSDIDLATRFWEMKQTAFWQ